MEAAAPAPLIRSVFFYNTHPQLGSIIGLHFFEPRYRILVQRALTEPQRQHSFVFLPNFNTYQATHGDIGYLATIVQHRPVPTNNPNELPRADVRLRFDARVIVWFHWLEPETGGLTECVCVPVDRALPPYDEIDPPSSADVVRLSQINWSSHFGEGARLLTASSQGYPDPIRAHLLLRAHDAALCERSRASCASEFPTIAPILYPVVVPPPQLLIPASTVIRRCGAIFTRLSMAQSAATAGCAASGASHATRAAAPQELALSELTEADVAALSVKELRAHLQQCRATDDELKGCIERDDLASLLVGKIYLERLALVTAAAADCVSQMLEGIETPLVCHCPTGGLAVRQCCFSRVAGSARLQLQRSGTFWGSQELFVVDERNCTNVGQICAAVYEWEWRELATGAADASIGSEDIADRIDCSYRVESTQPAINNPSIALAHACILHLGSPMDQYASPVVTPNLVHIWRHQADALVRRLSSELNWPRVRLLFLGLRQPSPVRSESRPEEVEAAAEAAKASPAAAREAHPQGSSCWFGALSRELLCMIVEQLIHVDAVDDRCSVDP